MKQQRVIQRAMGAPKALGADAVSWLARFVDDVKASGLAAAALARHGIQGAWAAPPAAP